MHRHRRPSTTFTLILSFCMILAALSTSLVNGTVNAEPYELLIIGLESYRTRIQRFIGVKQSQGIPARYISIESINTSLQGPDIVWRLHEFVAEEYERSGIRYLLLVGPYDQVPTRYTYSPSHELGLADFNYKPTDWYYAVPDWEDSKIGLLGGNIPKIAVGRLPVRNEEELDQTLSKIIEVETNLSPGSFLVFDDLNVALEPVPSVPHTYYASDSNLTSKPLSQMLSSGVAHVVTYTHGSPSALWTKAISGECGTLMTYKDVSDIEATYGIHYLVACFAGALDLENESLARALITSSTGPALVIASSRTEASDNHIPSSFWEDFFNTGDVGGSFLEALQSYLSDQTVFSPQEPMFQRYNLYLNKVVYGDISWRVKDPRKNIVVCSAPALRSESSVLNGSEAQAPSEKDVNPMDLSAAFSLIAVLLGCLLTDKIYGLHTKKRIHRKGQTTGARAADGAFWED